MHTPFEVADINNDGTKEIVLGAQGGALALHGNDGSTYWRNTDAPAEENYPAVADVNGDGYLEIFVCRGYGPINGIDYITELSYDGTIIAQAPSWHACWGGLTIGDPYSDGTYILYQGDRSYGYNPPEDNYKHGGWGSGHWMRPRWRLCGTILTYSAAATLPCLLTLTKPGI